MTKPKISCHQKNPKIRLLLFSEKTSRIIEKEIFFSFCSQAHFRIDFYSKLRGSASDSLPIQRNVSENS